MDAFLFSLTDRGTPMGQNTDWLSQNREPFSFTSLNTMIQIDCKLQLLCVQTFHQLNPHRLTFDDPVFRQKMLSAMFFVQSALGPAQAVRMRSPPDYAITDLPSKPTTFECTKGRPLHVHDTKPLLT